MHFAIVSCPMISFVYCSEGCTCIMPIWAIWIGFAHTILFVTIVFFFFFCIVPKGYTCIKPQRLYCTRLKGLWLEFNHIFCNLHTVIKGSTCILPWRLHCMCHECLWLEFGHKGLHLYSRKKACTRTTHVHASRFY